MTLRVVGAPAAPATPRWRVLGFGFRPFFLLASLFAVASMLAWLAALRGAIALDVAWHAHEMTFGFAAAVIAGFLLTAVPNWTGATRLAPAPLAALVALWLAGRAARWPALAAGVGALGTALDLAFLPALALATALPILRTRNRRNYGVVAILLALSGAHALFHAGFAPPALAARLGVIAPAATVHAIALLVVVIGGRVTPAFTANALRGAATVRAGDARDVAAIASAALALGLASSAVAPPAAVAVAAALAAVANAARMLGWATRAALRDPLLWILHAGYAWIVVGLALTALAASWPGRVPPSAALHAFGAGAIGTSILGMISRVALGHTGRALALPSAMRVAFAAISLAALARVAIPLFAPAAMALAWEAAGILWCIAFGLYAIVYFPILTAPRPDGKPG